MATEFAAYRLGGLGAGGWALTYFGLLVWLCAGLLDFGFHRRTDLPHTSGLGESTLHLLQLALVAGAIILGMLFEIEALVIAAMALLVLVPAALLCGLPALLEWRAAWRARHEPRRHAA